jgi:hypothetical protein
VLWQHLVKAQDFLDDDNDYPLKDEFVSEKRCDTTFLYYGIEQKDAHVPNELAVIGRKNVGEALNECEHLWCLLHKLYN